MRALGSSPWIPRGLIEEAVYSIVDLMERAAFCIVSLSWLAICLFYWKTKDLKDKRVYLTSNVGKEDSQKATTPSTCSCSLWDMVMLWQAAFLKRLMRTFHKDPLPAEAWSVSQWAKYKAVGRTDPQINMTHYSWENTFKLASAF